MTRTNNPVYNHAYEYEPPAPQSRTMPLIIDSPHSGLHYPVSFAFNCSVQALRRCEDAHIDKLYKNAPQYGAHFLAGNFPRSFIDTNRRADSLNPADIPDGLPHLPANEKDPAAQAGRGLIWQKCLDDDSTPIYPPGDRPDEAEVKNRLERYWRPYHEKLQNLLEQCRDEHGVAYHINCHSCPSYGSPLHMDKGDERADFILGDRFSTSCETAFTKAIGEKLESMGYSVAYNKPYAGAALVNEYSDPAQGIHCLQIEINRKLYMNEETMEPHEGYAKIRAATEAVMETAASYVRQRVLELGQDQKPQASSPAAPHQAPPFLR